MVQFRHPITGRYEDALVQFWIWELFRNIEKLIDKFIDNSTDYWKCEICGDFNSLIFWSELELRIHLRQNPKHVVMYYLRKMQLECASRNIIYGDENE